MQLEVTEAAHTEAAAEAQSAKQQVEETLLTKHALELELAQKTADLAEQVCNSVDA